MDLTREIFLYRDTVASLWNLHFMPIYQADNDTQDFLQHRYEDICDQLFEVIVLGRTSADEYPRITDTEPYPFLKVFLRKDIENSIMISRTPGDCGYWDCPPDFVRGDQIALQLVRLFDWQQFAYLTYPYLWVRIESFPAHPDLVGHDALVQLLHVARVEFAEENLPPGPGR